MGRFADKDTYANEIEDVAIEPNKLKHSRRIDHDEQCTLCKLAANFNVNNIAVNGRVKAKHSKTARLNALHKFGLKLDYSD